ncbi:MULTISPECIES: hypothetical protein [unclassified Streptomyces]|uniref:hypothetical protein n=1 Tax=unclassified Streptomyces TaxID=2593676 RepID=UPI00224D67D1|nr:MULTISPECIES: hypothetical protein [unclassified Streptomyces]MCX4524288.1 hypothetical protein [Streptomyces sp. NBC_01551]MCX4545192.1 hypothetical protein [Streptomyces sp. NBC_01565]
MATAENQIRAGGGDPVRPAEETSAPEGTVPPEHWRYARHLDSLAAAPDEAAEAERVAAVLRDPDTVMAESAVVTHMDRRAAQLLADERFPGWAGAMGGVLGGRAFPVRRLREWTLLKSINQGEPWSVAELSAASDWCQRTAVTLLTSYEALGLLAEAGRTRRVRNAAAQRLLRRTAG